MVNLFKLSYWFNMNPGALIPGALLVFVAFLLLLFVSIFLFLSLKKKRSGVFYKIFDRLQSFSIGNLIIGLFLLFFTSQYIPLLSARFWFLLWLLGMIFWLWFISRDIVKIPELKKKRAEEEQYKKYIP